MTPEWGDIVLIPVPFTDLTSRKRRPVPLCHRRPATTARHTVPVVAAACPGVTPAALPRFTGEPCENGVIHPCPRLVGSKSRSVRKSGGTSCRNVVSVILYPIRGQRDARCQLHQERGPGSPPSPQGQCLRRSGLPLWLVQGRPAAEGLTEHGGGGNCLDEDCTHGDVAFGISDGGKQHVVYAHEAGHNMIGCLDHNCYPQEIGEFGWDVALRMALGSGQGVRPKQPGSTVIMRATTGSAPNAVWVSPDLYTDIVDSGLTPPAGTLRLPRTFLAVPVSGTADWLSLGPAIEVQSTGRPLLGPSSGGQGDAVLVAKDASGNALTSQQFWTDADCDECPGGGANHVAARIRVPSTNPPQSLELYRNNVLVDSLSRSPHVPAVTIASPAPGSTLAPGTVVAWNATDGDGDPLQANLQYSRNGVDWEPIAERLPGQAFTLDPSALGASTAGSLRVLVSDGMNTTAATVGGLVVGPNRPPRVHIVSPLDGQTFRRGAMLILSAAARDPEDGGLADSAYTWYSDVDGLLGNGPILDVVGSTAGLGGYLSPGQHVITVQVMDAQSVMSSDQATVTIQ